MYVLPFIQRLRLAGVELERSSVSEVAIRFDQLQLPHLLDQLLASVQHVELAELDIAIGFYSEYDQEMLREVGAALSLDPSARGASL